MKQQLASLSFVAFGLICIEVSASIKAPTASECPDVEPRGLTTTRWGSQVTCGDTICGQNFAIDYDWECDLRSPGKMCVAGETKLSEIHRFACVSGACQTLAIVYILGPGYVAAPCEEEPPGPTE